MRMKAEPTALASNATFGQLRPVQKADLFSCAFECDPERAAELKAIIYREFREIANERAFTGQS
ncbi:MAG: hypothetical protein MZV63_21820 [Marinilabiliales bacterium]|nr:hypothetical protein [Marinilabiliales bacterium]